MASLWPKAALQRFVNLTNEIKKPDFEEESISGIFFKY
jgi:hypothetical protein